MDVCLQTKLQKSLQIIRIFEWLIDSYMLDFYVDDQWEKLPSSWRQCLEDLQPENLSELLDSGGSVKKLWPLSLLALKQLLKSYCINRKLKSQYFIPLRTLLDHPKLKYIFTKGVKPKKRHEIQRMAAICQRSCSETPVDFVVDFGAGLGHLARVLGYGLGIRVCCLEMQSDLNAQASLIDLQLETTASKHLSNLEIASFRRPSHVTLQLTADMKPQQFLSTICAALQLSKEDFRFGIIGLHPCGDLGAILLRMFLNCPQAKFLNFVGCCYMKLTTDSKTATLLGYPLSEYLRNQLPAAYLSYAAREISCHACEMYCDRLSVGDYEHLKVHSFRAAAERILTQHWPDLKHCGLKSVKHSTGMQFEDYFYRAVQGLSASQLSLTELKTPVTLADLRHWKRIVIFYTLRLMFAPLVESVILYDRILFLKENNCQVQINAIFDSRLSPRNHITSAVKRS